MYSAQAVLAALFERQKTGKGRHIEMALYDCGLMITSYYGLESMMLDDDPPRYGNAHPSIVPYGVFDAADGPIVIAVGTNRQYERFCREVIERPDLVDDERFRTNVVRAANRDVLVPELTDAIALLERAVLLERLTRAGIPCGEVLGLHEALTSKRAADAGLLTTVPHPEAGSTHVLAPPYRFDGARLPVRSAPPPLGEGTSEVLRSLLGLSQEQISRLNAQEVTS